MSAYETEQKAYDEANKAYQKQWRKMEPIRDHYRETLHNLLHVAPDNQDAYQPYVDAMFAARRKLRGGEVATTLLLDQREAAYKALVAARGS
ncbi:MAG: hypothetical protein EOP83_19755 [Verrucomicrobiaceae bacterium]|nr:MAG: hypothetical protein EOP83_19755 [Verrucomicrobiaceae bacterium]